MDAPFLGKEKISCPAAGKDERHDRVPFSTPVNWGIAIHVASQAHSGNDARMVDDVPRHCVVLEQADNIFYLSVYFCPVQSFHF